jgi:hypothetical protein
MQFQLHSLISPPVNNLHGGLQAPQHQHYKWKNCKIIEHVNKFYENQFNALSFIHNINTIKKSMLTTSPRYTITKLLISRYNFHNFNARSKP